MNKRKLTLYVSERAVARMNLLRSHYKSLHGLDLTLSAVTRRALDSLVRELGLAAAYGESEDVPVKP